MNVDVVPALYAAAMDGATDASAHVTEFPLLDEIVINLSVPVRLARKAVSPSQSLTVEARPFWPVKL